MFETARPFLLSLALGLMIGIERERAHGGREFDLPIGSRTFTLLALLGTLAASVGDPRIALALALFSAGIVLAVYMRSTQAAPGAGIGATTEVAAMATFALGFLAPRNLELTAMLGVIVVAVLALKPRIHQFAHAGLNPREVSSALAFLVIAFVVLPIVPDRTIDPYALVNPFRLWLLFVIIAGIGFGGYIAMRALGPGRGLAAAGLSAGLVSSTAATLSLSQRARGAGAPQGALAVGVVLANVASAAAQVAIAGLAAPALLRATALMLGAAVLVGGAGSLAAIETLRRLRRSPEPAADFAIESPLSLRSSAWLAAGLAAFLAIAALMGRWFGARGVLVTAAIGGAAAVHPVTFAVATLAAGGTIAPHQALHAILIAFEVNMVVKLVIVAWVGGRRLFFPTAPPMIAMMAAAALVFILR